MAGIIKINTRKKERSVGDPPFRSLFFLYTMEFVKGIDQDADYADIKSIFEYISLCI